MGILLRLLVLLPLLGGERLVLLGYVRGLLLSMVVEVRLLRLHRSARWSSGYKYWCFMYGTTYEARGPQDAVYSIVQFSRLIGYQALTG